MRLQILPVLLFLFCACIKSRAQHAPGGFKLVQIPQTGNSAYLPGELEDLKFDLSYSADSSKVFTGEFNVNTFRYSIIVVKLHQDALLKSNEDKDELLTTFMDFLKTSFRIQEAAGYESRQTLVNYPDAFGVRDLWRDHDQNNWWVKGWANEGTLAIMMVHGQGEYPDKNSLGLFLDGFRF